MICYAVIDTNVLVSALISSNASAATVQIVGRLISGEIIPVYSSVIMNEYREVLSREKFNFDSEMVNYILSVVEKYGILVEPSPADFILPDIKDLPFYEAVLEKHDENAYLVTGNLRYFPVEPFVITPRQMLDIIENMRQASHNIF